MPKVLSIALPIVAVLLGALMWFFAPTLKYICSRPSAPSPIDAHWVHQKLVDWKAEALHPIEIAAVLGSVSYGRVNDAAVTARVIATEVSLLVEARFSTIRIDLNYDPWLNGDAAGILKYDEAIRLIRESGKHLMIADAAAESYRHPRKVSWRQFKGEWVERVRTIAAKYQPDYYVVVKEPGWYWLMPSDALLAQPWGKPQDWIELTQQLIAAVKGVSPKTKVAIATTGDSLYHARTGDTLLTYYQAATAMPNLDILGFDNYTAKAFDDTLHFLKSVGTGGKEFWLLETWTQPGAKRGPEKETLDRDFINVAVAFAEKFGAQGVAFFFTKFLASYREPPRTEPGLLDFYSHRTAVFREVQKLSVHPVDSKR